MTLPRTAFMRSGLRAIRCRPQARSQPLRQVARRGYASEGGHKPKSSDLPWAIGAIAVTVPTAGWLISQGPDTSHHTTGEPGAKQDQPPPEKKGRGEDLESDGDEGGDKDDNEGGDGGGDEKAEKKDDDGGDDKGDDKGDDQGDDSKGKDDKPDPTKKDKTAPGPQKSEGDSNKPKDTNVKSSAGEDSSVRSDKSKLNFRRDPENSVSGAQHPYLDDEGKSKKGEGIKETAKIHGTVDSARPMRGAKDSGETHKDPKYQTHMPPQPSPNEQKNSS